MTDKNQTSDFCSKFPSGLFEVLFTPTLSIVLAVWNILLTVSAIVFNMLVFVAVRRNNSMRLPSKLLLLTLILTDLGTGAVAQPQLTAILLAKAANSQHIPCFLLSSFTLAISLLCSASLFTMAAISLDRFAVFFFHLKYREIVTTKRVCVLLVILWSISLLFSLASTWNVTLYLYMLIIELIVCLSTITAAYVNIYRGLRQHHGHQVQDQAHAQAAATALDMAKYRRTASSMMWIYGLFLLCYLPHLCLLFVNLHLHYEFLYNFTTTLVFLNSSLNPLVYCFRLPEIRAEVIRTVRKILRKNT